MPIYYLKEHCETTGRLWFYSKDETTDFNADIANDNNFKSFKYKAKLLSNVEAQPNPNHANGILKNATIAVPLKYLSNFWRLLEILLVKCKVELKLKWKNCCVLSEAGNDNANYNDNADDIIFTIKDTNLYVSVVTLSARGNQKISKLLIK